MANKKESFFWTSYSDLMTSLFFIMLVLFILVIVFLHKRVEDTDRRLKTSEKEKEEILKVVNSTKDLESNYFIYNRDYEKFVLNIRCWFPVGKYDIDLLDQETRQKLVEAGKQIKEFLDKHYENQYLVIIEGQASKNGAELTRFNYELSFNRALSLRYFWTEDLDMDFPENCELQIAGSGDGTLNVVTMREEKEEENQRFLIYVIPKNILKGEYFKE